MSDEIDPGIFLLWSTVHCRWIGRGAQGYVRGFTAAATFSRADALLIANNAIPARRGALSGLVPLLPVRLIDMRNIQAMHLGDGPDPL